MNFVCVMIQPLPLLLLTLGILLFRAWRKEPAPRRRLRCVVVAYGLLVVLCTPAAAFVALATLEWQYRPIDIENDITYDAAVVLGSAVYPVTNHRSKAIQDEAGRERTDYGACLYLRGRVPLVIVSGGIADPDGVVPIARVMAEI